MKRDLKFEDLPAALSVILDKVESLETEIKEIKKNFQPIEPPELMTRTEAAGFFKVNITTIHNWTKSGKLTSYGIGSRVYYKREEIENSLIQLKKF